MPQSIKLQDPTKSTVIEQKTSKTWSIWQQFMGVTSSLRGANLPGYMDHEGTKRVPYTHGLKCPMNQQYVGISTTW